MREKQSNKEKPQQKKKHKNESKKRGGRGMCTFLRKVHIC